MLTPTEFSTLHGVPYSTVMSWLKAGLIAKARAITMGKRTYWQIPEKANRPYPKRGAPKRKQENGNELD